MYTCSLTTTLGCSNFEPPKYRLDFAATELDAEGHVYSESLGLLELAIDPTPDKDPLDDTEVSLEQLALATWQRTMKWLVATGQSPRTTCTKVTIINNENYQVAYEPEPVVSPKRGFSETVNVTEMVRIAEWTGEQLTKNPLRANWTSEPRFELTFTPCGIGVGIHVKDLATGDEKNVTDSDSW